MWLERLDARVARAPRPVYWCYLALKWYLVLLGGFALVRVSLDRTGLWPFY